MPHNDSTANDSTTVVIRNVKRCLEDLFNALEPPAKKQMTSVQHITGAVASISLDEKEN